MEILITLKKTLPILLVIFVVVFFLILLTRLILFFCVNQAHKRYQNLKKIGQKILPKSKKYLKEDEELSLKKNEIPRANSAVKAEMKEKKNSHQSGSYEIIPSEEQELDRQEMNRVDIVDIVKPIGFWTSMILGQKLTYLIQSAQTLKKRDDKGFWASMVEAKERQAGRQHARGR
jgi:hypothetical protein